MTNSMRPSLAIEEINDALTMTIPNDSNRMTMEDTSILFHEDRMMMDDGSRLSNYDFSIQDVFFDGEDPHARLKNFDNERRASICSLGESLRINYVPRSFCCEEGDEDEAKKEEALPKQQPLHELQVATLARRGRKGLLASTKSTANRLSKSMRSLGLSKDTTSSNGGRDDHHHHHHGSVWKSMKSLTTLHHHHHHEPHHEDRCEMDSSKGNNEEAKVPLGPDEDEHQGHEQQAEQHDRMAHSNKNSRDTFDWNTKGTALEDDSDSDDDDDDDDVPTEEDISTPEDAVVEEEEEDDDEDFPVPRRKLKKPSSSSSNPFKRTHSIETTTSPVVTSPRRGGLTRATSLKFNPSSAPSSDSKVGGTNINTTPEEDEASLVSLSPRKRMGGLKRAASQRLTKTSSMDPSSQAYYKPSNANSNSSELNMTTMNAKKEIGPPPTTSAAGFGETSSFSPVPVRSPRSRMGGLRKATSFKISTKKSSSFSQDDPASPPPSTSTTLSPKPSNHKSRRGAPITRGLHQLKKAASFKISKSKTTSSSTADLTGCPTLVAGDLKGSGVLDGMKKKSCNNHLVGSSPSPSAMAQTFPPSA